MTRARVAWSLILGLALLAPVPSAAQLDVAAELAGFRKRVDQYTEMHRRLEGPTPPRLAAADMHELQRLMDDLRKRIRDERHRKPQGPLVTPAMALVLRQVIETTLTPEDVIELAADLEEHTPAGMPEPRVNEALPENAPFVMIAPQLIRALPRLPNGMRYVVLSKSLLVWDQHANLVVDVVPGLFDPLTYAKKGSTGT